MDKLSTKCIVKFISLYFKNNWRPLYPLGVNVGFAVHCVFKKSLIYICYAVHQGHSSRLIHPKTFYRDPCVVFPLFTTLISVKKWHLILTYIKTINNVFAKLNIGFVGWMRYISSLKWSHSYGYNMCSRVLTFDCLLIVHNKS